jgi:hypothetical protein
MKLESLRTQAEHTFVITIPPTIDRWDTISMSWREGVHVLLDAAVGI